MRCEPTKRWAVSKARRTKPLLFRRPTIHKAERELGTLRASDAGGGSGSFMRMVTELGYSEGVDLSRIEMNRVSTIEALQAKKGAAGAGASDTIAM